MLQLRNETGFAATIMAAADPDGVDTLFTVVKGTFRLDAIDPATGTPAPAEEQVPPVLADEFHGEPDGSSIRLPSDLALAKAGTDVLLLGSARAPAGRQVTWVDVGVRVGPVQKAVRVFGDRQWSYGGTGWAPSTPRPFERIPLVWERAFGGTERRGDEVDAEARNPVGTGFRGRLAEGSPEGTSLPNLEDPFDPIRGPDDRPSPAAFGPLAAHWHPRIAYAGTYDEAWQARRAPILPEDFDPRFFQMAPPDLVAPGFLEGGERVDLMGVRPEGTLTFHLPAVEPRVVYRVAGREEARPARLDTVILEPDEGRVVLVWRAALGCDKEILKVTEVVATAASGRVAA